MSKPRYRWWGYARNVVRAYPKLMATKSLTTDDLRDRDAVTMAIDITMRKRKGEELLALIKGVYWGSVEQRIEDVALRLYIADITAKRWHGEFIRTVGKCLGLYVEDNKEDPGEQKENVAG